MPSVNSWICAGSSSTSIVMGALVVVFPIFVFFVVIIIVIIFMVVMVVMVVVVVSNPIDEGNGNWISNLDPGVASMLQLNRTLAIRDTRGRIERYVQGMDILRLRHRVPIGIQ